MRASLIPLAIILCLANLCQADQIQPLVHGDNFSYYEAYTTTQSEGLKSTIVDLAELKDIPTAGYKSIRVFFSIYDFPKLEENSNTFPNINVSACHDLPGGSTPYKTEQIAVRTGVGQFCLLEAPVIGTKIRVLITGLNIPEGKVKIATTVYLLK